MIILHGLFGSSDNWFTHSKKFAEHFEVYLVDQRNHGQSPHSDDMNYRLLTEDLAGFISANDLDRPIVLGHSMGGKTAMNYAISHPGEVGKLVVVDIMPKSYPVHHDHILEGLMAIEIDEIKSRNEADEILAQHVPELAVRQFLLKNLSRNESQKFEWKINLDALSQHIEDLGAGLQYDGVYEGPTLFVKGAKSNYYKVGDEVAVKKFFPNAEIVTVDTGHWVQAEKPEAFMEAVLPFLQD